MTYTDDQLLGMEIPQRFDTVRWDLLAPDFTLEGTLSVELDQPPSVTLDTGRDIMRSLQGFRVDATQEQDLDTVTARVRPVVVLQNGSEFPMGVFLFADASRLRRSFGLELDASLVDQNLVVTQPWHDGTSYQTGTSVADALETLALRVNLPATSIEDNGTLLGTPIAWPIGTSTLESMRGLCALAGYLPPYFDNAGTLVCRSAPDFSIVTPDFTYGAGTRVVADTIVESDDLLSAPNRWVVVGANPSQSEIVGIYDVPDSAPHSYMNRGFYVTEVIRAQGIVDAFQAVEMARAAAEASAATFRWVSFDATLDPRHDTFDAVEWLSETYREVGWSARLETGGTMTHDLRRAY